MNFVLKKLIKLFRNPKIVNTEINNNVFIDPKVFIQDSVVDSYAKLFGPGRVYKSNIGKYSYAQYNHNIAYTNLGSFCSIGPNFLSGMGDHVMDKGSTHPLFSNSSNPWGLYYGKEDILLKRRITKINPDSWIGANVYIKDGVEVGVGSVIGAGSIVTKNTPPYSISAGVPAKIINYRFNDFVISQLVDSRWWEVNDLSQINSVFNSIIRND